MNGMNVKARDKIRGLTLFEVPDRDKIANPKMWGVAFCCRDWKVHLTMPIKSCGYCGEVPLVVYF